MEKSEPRLMTAGAIMAVSLYGVLLMIPVIISLLWVSVLPLGVLTWLIPLLVLLLVTFFLPFGFGNPYISRLARRLPSAGDRPPDSLVVQMTVSPRLRSGLRGLMEDADDIGWLSLGPEMLLFQGDSIRLSVPFGNIQKILPRTIGLRGLFLYPCVELELGGLPGVSSVKFAERSSTLLPACHSKAKALQRRLKERTALLPRTAGN